MMVFFSCDFNWCTDKHQEQNIKTSGSEDWLYTIFTLLKLSIAYKREEVHRKYKYGNNFYIIIVF